MDYILPTLGTIAAVLSILVAFALAGGMKMFTMRAPSGPDAMGLAAVFVFQIGGWVFLLLSAFMGLGRGSIDWISSAGGIPSLVVLLTVVALAVLAIVAACVSMETRYKWRTLAGLSGALVMPIVAALYVLALLWLPLDFLMQATWPRVVGWIWVGLAGIVYLGAAVFWYKQQEAKGQRAIAYEREREEERKRFAEEARVQEFAHDAELDAIPDDAPLETFLSHLFIDKSESHQAKAISRIDSLPNLVARIEERLSNPLPIQREYCANYVRRSALPHTELIPAFRKSVVQLAQDYRTDLRDPSGHLITHIKGLTWGTLLTIQRYPSRTFAEEVGTLRAAVLMWPKSDERNSAIEYIDLYLKGERVPD